MLIVGVTALVARRFRTQYAQICLIDVADHHSYPTWTTGSEPMVSGPRGVAVSTADAPEIEVHVVVGTGSTSGADTPIGAATISIGHQGAIVGNVAAADTEKLDLDAGEWEVTVWGTAAHDPERLVFVLSRNP